MTINKNYLLKLKYILPSFSLFAWGSVIVLIFVRWFFFLGRYPILEVDEEIWNFWISVIFPWIPILLWLRPRFDRLIFKKNDGSGSWRMQILACIPMAVMLIFAQHYLTTATGKLLELDNVKQIARHGQVRYYRIKNFAVHRPIGGVHYAFRTTGKYNQTLNIDIYFVNPILTHKNQYLTMTPLYWYGVKFHKEISNLKSRQNKEARFRKFFDECVAKMQKYDFQKLDHFENKPASYDRKHFRVAVQYALRKPVNNDFVILQPQSQPAELRNGNKLAWIFVSYAIGIGILMLALIRPKLQNEVDEDSMGNMPDH